MKKFAKVLALVLALTLSLVSVALADSSARTLDEIKESGKLVIGVFSDKKPFGYVDENGEYQGYDVYLARRLAEDLGVELELVSVDAPNRVEYLQASKVDIILALTCCRSGTDHTAARCKHTVVSPECYGLCGSVQRKRAIVLEKNCAFRADLLGQLCFGGEKIAE